MPLRRKHLRRNKARTGHNYRVYGTWETPDIDIVPRNLRNATTLIVHKSTAAERQTDPHTRRVRALSTIAPTDPRFQDLYGVREDTESQNSHTKSRLRDRRAREVGRDPIRLGLIGLQILTLTTALNAHRHQTGADLTSWFGEHRLRTTTNPRAGPTRLAA